MKTIVVLRDLFYDGKASLGSCLVYDEDGNRLFKGVSLERGWMDNKSNISCIPEGEYPVKLEWSPRFEKDLWEIYGVPGRSECKFHAANYWKQLNGCIALGRAEAQIDGDGIMDITSSRDTMDDFHDALAGETEANLIVKNVVNLIL